METPHSHFTVILTERNEWRNPLSKEENGFFDYAQNDRQPPSDEGGGTVQTVTEGENDYPSVTLFA